MQELRRERFGKSCVEFSALLPGRVRAAGVISPAGSFGGTPSPLRYAEGKMLRLPVNPKH